MSHKYKKGERITMLHEMVSWLNDGNFVYIRDRFTHTGWIMNFQLRYAMMIVRQGIVFKAIKQEAIDGK